MSDSSRWLPISAAARAANVGERTAYRHAAAKRVPTRTGDGGVVEVDVAALRALARAPRSAAASRKTAPSAPAAAVGGGDGGGGSGGMAEPQVRDGELASQVFQALERGARPVDLVSQLHAAPADVAALVKSWRDLRGGEGDTLLDRVAELEAQVGALQAALAAVARVLPPEGAQCPQCGRARTLALALHCIACSAPAVIPPAPAPLATS